MRPEPWAPRDTASADECLATGGGQLPGAQRRKWGQVEGGQVEKGETHHSPHPGSLEKFWKRGASGNKGVLSRPGLHPTWLMLGPTCPFPRAPPLSPQGLTLPIRISLHIWCSPNSAPWELERVARQAWVH